MKIQTSSITLWMLSLVAVGFFSGCPKKKAPDNSDRNQENQVSQNQEDQNQNQEDQNQNQGDLNQEDQNQGDLNQEEQNQGDLNQGDLNQEDQNQDDLNQEDQNQGDLNQEDQNQSDNSDPGEISLNTCEYITDCAVDEACTQGGHCVNITGERDATAALQADLDALGTAHGNGIPYRLPANAILQLNDLDDDGVALTIETPLLFDGAGSLLLVPDNTAALRVEPTAPQTQIRDLRIDPRVATGTNDSIGVDVRAYGVRLDNLHFWRLGTGVRADSELDGQSIDLAAQNWARLVFEEIHHYALNIRGRAGKGLLEGLELIDSAGIYDASEAGNTYLAPSIEGSHTRSIELAGTDSHNLVLGAYIESGDPAPKSNSPTDFMAGGNAITRHQGPAERLGQYSAMMHFVDPDSGMEATIPGDEDSAISWSHPREGARWSLRYFKDPSQLKWGISHEGSTNSPFFWTSAEHRQGPGHLEVND